jgi:uncharacterized protein
MHGSRIDIRDLLMPSVIGWTAAVLTGVAGILLAKWLKLPDLRAAQATLGLFGLAGGISHARLIRSAGGTVSVSDATILSLTWAIVSIGAVTPLFFTSALPLKLAVLTFYCFAAAGAVGGTATALILAFSFDDGRSRDWIPGMIAWGFSFGIAATVSSGLSETAGRFLPQPVAWALAFGIMAVILGCGSAYALSSYLRSEAGAPSPLPLDRPMAPAAAEHARAYLPALLLVVPFFLNDFANIYVTDWRLWLVIDYLAVKLLPLIVVVWLIRTGKMRPVDFGLTLQPPGAFIVVFLIAALAGTFIDQNGTLIFGSLPGYPALGRIPVIENRFWNWVDLTAGLILVGFFEELIFRGYLYRVLSRYTQNRLVIVPVSAVVFGLIHWSGGSVQVLTAAAVGALFMALYIRTRSLPAIMLAHVAVNFIDFAGIIPREIFRYL